MKGRATHTYARGGGAAASAGAYRTLGLLQMHVGCKRSLLKSFRANRVLKLYMRCRTMASGPGPASWTGRGRPVPGLAVGRPSWPVATALGGPKEPFRTASRAVIRGYSTPSHISCYCVAERSPTQQSGTGPTSRWYGQALVSRALLLDAVHRRYRARRERRGGLCSANRPR